MRRLVSLAVAAGAAAAVVGTSTAEAYTAPPTTTRPDLLSASVVEQGAPSATNAPIVAYTFDELVRAGSPRAGDFQLYGYPTISAGAADTTTAVGAVVDASDPTGRTVLATFPNNNRVQDYTVALATAGAVSGQAGIGERTLVDEAVPLTGSNAGVGVCGTVPAPAPSSRGGVCNNPSVNTVKDKGYTSGPNLVSVTTLGTNQLVYTFDKDVRQVGGGIPGQYGYFDQNGTPHFGDVITSTSNNEVRVQFTNAADVIQDAAQYFVDRNTVRNNLGGPTSDADHNILQTIGAVTGQVPILQSVTQANDTQWDFTFNEHVVANNVANFHVYTDDGFVVDGSTFQPLTDRTIRVTFAGPETTAAFGPKRATTDIKTFDEQIVGAYVDDRAVQDASASFNQNVRTQVGISVPPIAPGWTSGPDLVGLATDSVGNAIYTWDENINDRVPINGANFYLVDPNGHRVNPVGVPTVIVSGKTTTINFGTGIQNDVGGGVDPNTVLDFVDPTQASTGAQAIGVNNSDPIGGSGTVSGPFGNNGNPGGTSNTGTGTTNQNGGVGTGTTTPPSNNGGGSGGGTNNNQKSSSPSTGTPSGNSGQQSTPPAKVSPSRGAKRASRRARVSYAKVRRIHGRRYLVVRVASKARRAHLRITLVNRKGHKIRTVRRTVRANKTVRVMRVGRRTRSVVVSVRHRAHRSHRAARRHHRAVKRHRAARRHHRG